MRSEIITVITLSVIAVFLIAAVIGTIAYEIKSKHRKLTEYDPEDWLFSNFHRTVYDMFFGKSTSDKICGLDREEYERKCRIIHEKPQFETIVGMRLEGIFILIIACLIGYAMSASMIAEVSCIALGGLAFFALWRIPESRLNTKVEAKLFYVSDDLPRFLSLLEKAMDLPIDQAIMVTASKFDSPLSEDLIDSINKVALGADGWQETLTDLAKTYQIEDFSDLVLDITNSYSQGINIRPIVERKSHEIEQSRLLAVESHDAKIKTMIYLPIIAFKVLPLMVLICLPMAGDFL